MRIVRIIPEIDALLSVHNDDEEQNEFDILFDNWNDVELLYEFFKENKQDLGRVSIQEAVEQTLEDAANLEEKLLDVAEGETELQTLFKPLSNNEYRLKPYQKSKVYGTIYKSWLRVYAIRINPDLFVVTGGAIKLTQTMNEREHTKEQLARISKARDYLKAQGFNEDELENLKID